MIRARASNGVFILGIEKENVRRLKNGQPILVSLLELGGTDDVLIMYGETLEDIKKELEQFDKLPDTTKLKKARNEQ